MNKTAAIYRPVAARSSTAAVTRPAGGEPLATVRCALSPQRGRVMATAAGLILEVHAVAYFPAGTDLRPRTDGASGEGDVVEIDGARYRVIAVRDVAGRGRLLEAALGREA